MFCKRLCLVLTLTFAQALAFADCTQRIDALDQRLKSSPPDARVASIVTEVRKRAVDLCMAGQEAAAMQTLQMLEGMLRAPHAESSQQPEEPAGPVLNDTDYTGGHQPVARKSSNPWDALSGRQICDWLPADEIEEAFGLAVELRIQRNHWQCNYRFLMPNGYSATAFIFYVEPHDNANYPREAETRMSTGFIGTQFERFDPGTPLLHGYNSVRAPYLYVYPTDGITMWKLDFLKDSPEKDVMFGSAPQPPNLGKAFLTLLIDKYRDRFEADLN